MKMPNKWYNLAFLITISKMFLQKRRDQKNQNCSVRTLPVSSQQSAHPVMIRISVCM